MIDPQYPIGQILSPHSLVSFATNVHVPLIGSGVSYHLLCISPCHNDNPKIEKMYKNRQATTISSPNLEIDLNRVDTIAFMAGNDEKFLSG